jgi:transposase
MGGLVRALDPNVIEAVWEAAAPQLAPPPADDHPLGCHRRRIADKICFTGILFRLVLGCSWVDAARLVGVSATTLRRRRDDWIAAGIFDALADQAIAAYDRIRGLDLSEVSVDGSIHKAPGGGDGTGPNPTDRGTSGWKWSIATDADGIPIGWATDGATTSACWAPPWTPSPPAGSTSTSTPCTSTAATTPTPCAPT